MLGWIHDCMEKLVIEKFGVDAWHTIKEKAGCDVPDGDFLKVDHYSDKSTIDLVVAASDVSGLSVDQVLETFGVYFVGYIKLQGYDDLIRCQGRTLKDWINNINEIHSFLQTSFPKQMTSPEFWCDEMEDSSLTIHYLSTRGHLLAPVAKGMIIEIARLQFGLDIVMDRINNPEQDSSKFTSWSIKTKDPSEMYKLGLKKEGGAPKPRVSTTLKCPMFAMTVPVPTSIPAYTRSPSVTRHNSDSELLTSLQAVRSQTRDSIYRRQSTNTSTDTASTHLIEASDYSHNSALDSAEPGGLAADVTKKLFPFHVIVNSDLIITHVGIDLPRTLKTTEEELIGQHVEDVFLITKPDNAEWNWDWLRILDDQSFFLAPVSSTAACSRLKFKASVTIINDDPMEAMLISCPDANDLEELKEMKLTLTDLPVHGSHRDSIFLREHLRTQTNNALSMEKLSKSLTKEKALLESLLPLHAAEGLRMGRTVEPMLHNNVTLFFSDVVGFTNICKQISPWEVISMLNRLYYVMDHLDVKFNLFKVETIGDAYVCCSGLPEADAQHAEKVANFAVAVNHCCKQILSPIDGHPMELRIGIHTGVCVSGVVGVTNPRYCVFGDTVNTAARHESTGEPGRIHCSQDTCTELRRSAMGKFELTERGLVDMKGKGKLRTFWLKANEDNKAVNKAALTKFDEEVRKLLEKTDLDCQYQKNCQKSHDLKQESFRGSSLQRMKSARQIVDRLTSIFPESDQVFKPWTIEEEHAHSSQLVEHTPTRTRQNSSDGLFFV